VFDIVGRRRWFYLLSLAVTVPGLIFILLTLVPGSGLGLRFSIAYTGGTIWEVHFRDGTPHPADVRAVLEQAGFPGSEVVITSSDAREYVLIRTEELALIDAEAARPASAPEADADGATPGGATDDPEADEGATAPGASPGPSPPTGGPVPGVPTSGEFGRLADAVQAAFGPIDEVRQQESVGPVVSGELIQQTFLLILFGAGVIMLYITLRFNDFRMGAAAVVALVHDVLVVVGLFAVLGTLVGLQIDAFFVTAMLTVIGFSVNDTIVVFDRIRENRVRHAGEPLEVIVNHSLLQTMGRSLATSLTVILPLAALLLFGGSAIQSFIFALLVGVAAGTYSSICNASQLFVDWHLWDERRRARRLAEAAAG
jgi:preprotein translocase subunit SecF